MDFSQFTTEQLEAIKVYSRYTAAFFKGSLNFILNDEIKDVISKIVNILENDAKTIEEVQK